MKRLALLALLLPLVATAQPSPGLFRSIEFPADDLGALPQWRDVLERLERERPLYQACDRKASACRTITMTVWRSKLAQLDTMGRVTQLWEVNRYVNGSPYVDDTDIYHVPDHWATPLEFLERSGDDEDRSIMKFVMLRELGFRNDQLRLAVVSDVLRNQLRVIVVASLGGKYFVLDSDTDTIRSDHTIRYLVPYYSMNETTRWAHITTEGAALP